MTDYEGMLNIREMLYENERKWFSPHAQLSSESRGRLHPCREDDFRLIYQRDRDRILHCKAFRRLSHKTQVFLSPEGDHYRTRLTHTLEVTQIARSMARALRLNEDLTEAISMGHDLGHTPFGHSGEDVLNECCPEGFSHYKQSLRVVDCLEHNGKGLNLTMEVRDGIVNHTGKNMASTLEGVLVKYADRIAYINHDIDDAVRAGVLTEGSIPQSLCKILGQSHAERIDTMVKSLVKESDGQNFICMEPEIEQATKDLRDFMFENVYRNPVAKKEENKAKELIHDLYEYFYKNPDKMPEEYHIHTEDPISVRVRDYISSMTDRYAVAMYERLHIPEKFREI